MTGFRRALWALGIAGLLLGLVVIPVTLKSHFLPLRGVHASLAVLGGWGFIATGLYAWARRPSNNFGQLMTATGFLFFVAMLSAANDPTVFTLGSLFGGLFLATTVHLLLAFPSGRLDAAGDRAATLMAYTLASVLVLPFFLTAGPDEFGCEECPDNVLLVTRQEDFAEAYLAGFGLAVFAVTAYIVVRLIVRWRAARPRERHAHTPVLFAGMAFAFFEGMSELFGVAGVDGVEDVFTFAAIAAFLLLPFAFLAGLARSAMLRGGALGELLERLGEAPNRGDLRAALADALGDPTLGLAYWLPDAGQYVDHEGHRVELPSPGSGRTHSEVELEDRKVAALLHDGALRQDPALVRRVGAAAALALENERLEAELRAKVEELRSSRQRLVDAEFHGRRRLERDLHDGAQQRLVSLALNLRLARAKLGEDPVSAEQLLDAAREELDLALGELRELARGIHPAVLSDRGLDAALQSLAARAPLSVEVAALPLEKLPDQVESAAYFVVSEALTNVTKYAHASRATVRITRANGRVVVEVSDDGVGGADPAKGSGLRGLGDRVAALDGRLAVHSEPGEGTTVLAQIPFDA